MGKLSLIFICCASLFGQKTPSSTSTVPPSHRFHSASALTEPSGRQPREIGEAYLRSVAPEYGWSAEDLAGVYLAREFRTAHNGVTHLLFRQSFDDVDVETGEWTVNVDENGSVLNAGGHFYRRPALELKVPEVQSGGAAIAAAMREIQPSVGATSFLPQEASMSKGQR